MLIKRRTVLQLGMVGLVGAAVAPARVLAATPVLDTVEVMAPGSVGGGYDANARALAAALVATGLVGAAPVSNVPGAGGTVGLAQFAQQHDGDVNSLFVFGSTLVSSIIANKSAVDLDAVTPLARTVGSFNAMAVPAESPYKDAKAVFDAFKADPKSIIWCGGSVGGGDHMIVGMLAEAAGVDAKDINYVAYSGGNEVLAAILGNQVTVALSGWSEFKDQVAAGKLRCLGISADRAFEGVPYPTFRDQGIDVVFYGWGAVAGAGNLSDADRGKLLAMIDDVAKSQEWATEIANRGLTNLYLSGPEFEAYIKDQSATFGATLKRLGLA